jgi:hypothetical protein
MNDTASSYRVIPADRSWNCDDLVDGEFALFKDVPGDNTQVQCTWGPNGKQQDCVVLDTGIIYYNTPADMGIGNDSISYVANNSAYPIRLFHDANRKGISQTVAPYSFYLFFPSDPMNDQASSIQVIR